ncbi:MAG TPA: transglutaminase family protein [Candidatus Sulfotelmatobacter sp.]|nr:transglutaminase family protein [Candidatus Sulfotelmatobacter sp.]
MAIQVALTHKTSYRYDRQVTLGPQVVRLRPTPHCRTPILGYSLRVTPKQHFLNWQQDPQSNYLARFVFPEKTGEFSVEVDLIAEMAISNPFDFFLEKAAETFPFAYDAALAKELRPYLKKQRTGRLLAAFLRTIDRKPRSTIDFLVELNRAVQQRVSYVIRMEPGLQTCEQTLAHGRGACRDSAWLLVQVARHMGLAARFVSGYLIQLTADQAPIEGPSGPAQDFTDLHAWTEVYLPGAGWIGLDPTSGLLAGEGHIPLACTPDAGSAAPVSGEVEMCEVEFGHEMAVTRLAEKPRTTKPYMPAQWQAIDALGQAVDRELQAADVRLTMGGEPTFVSIDDPDGAEWNIAAVGPTKRLRAAALIDRLMRRFAPGGLLHFGQGKWYPGESLPRWALTAYWRRDGDAIWANGEFLAREEHHYGFGMAEAERFMAALTRRLNVDAATVRAGYEDPWHYVQRERKLPVNVDPLDSKLDDEEERARIARVFERGLERPIGLVLPINRRHEASGPYWQSSAWPLRQERMLLHPGDSPMGLRLPLGSLPWVAAEDYPFVVEQDPFEPRAPLPPRQPGYEQPAERKGATEPRRQPDSAVMGEVMGRGKAPETPLARGTSAPWVVRTALCVEPRDGKLYVFLPPLALLEDYLELVQTVEAAAVDSNLPVIIEGYPPPRDPRMNSLSVTPDPGVIEVNIHPAPDWDALVRTTKDLYEDARQSRLTTEKFMIDGRHVGTGGGNHLVVGGPTAGDSPFLRRPDLLRSLVTYWQNHPALSYLFSGLFIGPTSQAPRIDEARDDILYELEIAFGEIARAGPAPPPWLVDRTLRHILTDVQGNTHRSEFCIDKLYSPDGPSGRLGLVELRGFEMPPHAEMSLTQQLLLRALIARFWREPYVNRLVRWGTELHDRFMLPYFVAEDLRDVVADLRAAGYPFEDSWFAPHVNFRFPIHGTTAMRSIQIELRHALEPWHVLGEEPGGGGTARFVDSSLERLQVRVSGMVGERHAVACNGWRMPLHPTGVEGEFVAGIRFRAWQPASALHPTIPPHGPLVFDLVDTWSGRSIGGCTYHVSHPGGRNYATRPVNAHEAEGRRLARFSPIGHTQGPFEPRVPPANADFPLTLDLRRV